MKDAGEPYGYQIVIEGHDYEQMQELFETIQNKYSFYDNCVIQDINKEDTLIDDDRNKETGYLLIHQNEEELIDENECILCEGKFIIGEDGNELGFCTRCQERKDFPYDLDAYYEDHDQGKVGFKGFDTMSRGLLKNYEK